MEILQKTLQIHDGQELTLQSQMRRSLSCAVATRLNLFHFTCETPAETQCNNFCNNTATNNLHMLAAFFRSLFRESAAANRKCCFCIFNLHLTTFFSCCLQCGTFAPLPIPAKEKCVKCVTGISYCFKTDIQQTYRTRTTDTKKIYAQTIRSTTSDPLRWPN